MDVAVPFDAVDPKTRLAGPVDDEERRELATVLLRDVLDVIEATGRTPTVYATADVDVDADVVVDERGLDALVRELADDPPVAVVMADLGLLTPAVLDRLFETDGEVVAAPGLGGGTNALVVRDDGFEPDFHGTSFVDHAERARAADLEWTSVDSMRLAVDVDEPADLVEVLLHGQGKTPAWLRDRGISITDDDGRATLQRKR